MEKLLKAQILNYLQEQSLICDGEQAGFLPGQSTVTQLFLINRWRAAIDRGEGAESNIFWTIQSLW